MSDSQKGAALDHDLAIVGGGLQGVLLALACHSKGQRVLLLESGPRLGGNHLWSFHAGDVPAEARELIEPLVVARWPAYEVAFADRTRRIDEPYASISSARLDEHARAALGGAVLLGVKAARLDARSVILEDGRRIEATRVIDCRGPGAYSQRGAHVFQKFAGVELLGPHTLKLPMLMDARVRQDEGFRFVYVLPLAPDRVLVEDTRFSEEPGLEGVSEAAQRWARENGLRGQVVRRESGVLPLPLDALPALDPARAGYAGGFFHPVTGYSLPLALRFALRVASGQPLELAQLRAQQKFALLLNRLLYRATEPADRWRVLSRFHALPAATLRRFYALETTRADRARILCGRPPRGVNLRKALEALA